jgi:hypothetical protein
VPRDVKLANIRKKRRQRRRTERPAGRRGPRRRQNQSQITQLKNPRPPHFQESANTGNLLVARFRRALRLARSSSPSLSMLVQLSPRNRNAALASSSYRLNGFDVLVEPSANPRTVFPNSINSSSVTLRSRSRSLWRTASSDSNPIMCRSGRNNGKLNFTVFPVFVLPGLIGLIAACLATRSSSVAEKLFRRAPS